MILGLSSDLVIEPGQNGAALSLKPELTEEEVTCQRLAALERSLWGSLHPVPHRLRLEKVRQRVGSLDVATAKSWSVA